jgi:ABC-type branched-subunit amino acid transport system ATPase component
LSVNGLDAGYGDLQILHGIDLELWPGECVLVFGPNGAGKSTLLKAILGLIRPWRGEIRFQGKEISGLPPEKVVALGISYVPQMENVFSNLTVEENLEIGAVLARDQMQARMAEMVTLFPRLGQRLRQAAGTLSGGEQQMLAMARALMLGPELLLLDEPTAGLAPLLVEETLQQVAQINERGTAVFVVEQNVKQALPVSDRSYVLEMGRNRYQAKSDDILHNEEIGRLYLGS